MPRRANSISAREGASHQCLCCRPQAASDLSNASRGAYYQHARSNPSDGFLTRARRERKSIGLAGNPAWRPWFRFRLSRPDRTARALLHLRRARDAQDLRAKPATIESLNAQAATAAKYRPLRLAPELCRWTAAVRRSARAAL